MSRSLLVRPSEIPRPLIYFNFDDDFVNVGTLRDVMGANDATINGGVTSGVTGRVGEAFAFDGTGHLEIGDVPFTAHHGANGVFTIACVCTPDFANFANPSGMLLVKDNSAVTNQREFLMDISLVSNEGEIHVTVLDTGTPGTLIFSTPGDVIFDGVTHHVAAVYDNTASANADKVQIYIDGRPVVTSIIFSSGSFTAIQDDTEPFRIGARRQNVTITEFFAGTIDEAAWYGAAFTEAQVAELAGRALAGRRAFAQPPQTDYSLWWSARDVDGAGNVGLSADPRVQTLVDHGSVGADASQATAGKRPLLLPARNAVRFALDGHRAFRPGVRFDGVDDLLTFASQTFGDFTVFLLTSPRADQDTSTTYPVMVRNNALDPQGAFRLGAANADLTDEVVSVTHVDGGAVSRGSATSDSSLVIPGGEPSLVVAALDGTVSAYRLNGVDQAVQEDPSGGLDSGAGFSLQNIDALFGRDTSPQYSAGVLFELLLYARALSVSEQQELENFFAEEYPGVEALILGIGSGS